MLHQERVAHAIGCLEAGLDLLQGSILDHQRRIGAVVADMHTLTNDNVPGLHALAQDLRAGIGCHLLEGRIERRARGWRKPQLDRPFAHRRQVGKPHAIRRQHTGIGVDVDARDAQLVGDQAGVLSAGAAKTLQGVMRDVIAACHRHLLDRIGHVLDGDLDETLRHFLRRSGDTGGRLDLARHGTKLRRAGVIV